MVDAGRSARARATGSIQTSGATNGSALLDARRGRMPAPPLALGGLRAQVRAAPERPNDMADDERVTMELLPKDSLAWYHEMFGEAPVMVALHRQGRFLYLNRAAQEGLGATSPEQLLGRDVLEFTSPDDQSLVQSRIEAVTNSHVMAPLRHVRFRRLDGTLFDVEVMTVPVTVGGVEVAQSIAMDVTERFRVERAFAQSEEMFASAFAASPDGIVFLRRRDLRILNANPAWCALTGTDPERVDGMDLRELRVSLKPDEQRELLARVEHDGHVRDFPLQFLAGGGTEWRHATVSTELLELAGEACVLVIARDVTEDRLLQARLRQSQKMDAVGQLAGGIAHDFNNLLTVIRANAELVIGDLAPSLPSQEDLGSILTACDRAAALTRQLLAFSRTQSLDIRPFDLNETLRTAGQMIARMLGPAISIEWRLRDVPLVLADRGQVEQILMNLLVNARDAMAEGGAITLETMQEQVTEETFREQVTGIVVVPGPFVRWTVTDRGQGMSPEIRARVFEPFFTTKQPGSGTGLGLSTVYGIVKQSQGYIWIDSTEGEGTSVHVYLPVAPGQAK
jgi:two-component system, cell cycle sensor histidine kinase and response regulator CckA